MTQRWIINSGGMLLTIWLVPGVWITDSNAGRAIVTFAGLLLAVGGVNMFVGPVANVLELRLMFVFLSLLVWVGNLGLLYLLEWVCGLYNGGFYLSGPGPASAGAAIITATAILFTWLLPLVLERSLTDPSRR